MSVSCIGAARRPCRLYRRLAGQTPSRAVSTPYRILRRVCVPSRLPGGVRTGLAADDIDELRECDVDVGDVEAPAGVRLGLDRGAPVGRARREPVDLQPRRGARLGAAGGVEAG